MAKTRLEQETILLFNEAEKLASVYTHNKRLKGKLERLLEDRPDEMSLDYNGDYLIPKKWIKINAPRVMSDEERQRASERIRRFTALNRAK